MGNVKTGKSGPQTGEMAKALRERERLDQIIEETFKKKRAIIFSDVCGFTQYMDKMGDIRGRAWIQKHHDIVLPLIEAYDGKVLDIMGDGIMASFPETLSAAKASIAIQKGLDEHNSRTNSADMIHVKIGINTGEVLEDGDHVAGDVVNVASRIQSQSVPDQILISKKVYDEICGCDDILCRHYGSVHVKGKAEPLELYRIVWKHEEVVITSEPKVRASEKEQGEGYPPFSRELFIEVMQEKDHLKIGASEQLGGEPSTVRHYEEVPVSMAQIGARCREIIETLNKANRQGRVSRDILIKLREVGQVFNDDLFTHTMKEKIRETKADHLLINIDDQLVQVPWELIHDGRQFLCRRFSMGRLVRTRQEAIGSGRFRALARPLKMLILADPRGDLKWAYKEGTEIRNYIDSEIELINVALRTDNVTTDYIRERLRNFDLVHFAGHYDYDRRNPWQSCWRLKNGGLKGEDIGKMAGTGAMPTLIFSNACQSALADEWALSESIQDEIFGLANAFILAGVKHYVGTFWEILDEPSRRFALQFYKYLLKGLTIGEAVRQARLAVIQEYGEETIVWASYLLYGDPTFNYIDQIKGMAGRDEKPESSHVPLPETDIRAREEVIDFAVKKPKKRKIGWLAFAAIGFIAVVVLLFGYPGLLREKTSKYEQAALMYLAEGKFEEALNTGKTLADKDPQNRLGYLVQGEIYYRKGKVDDARAAYEMALSVSKGTDLQKAKALIGLGRIASLQKKNSQALEYYRQSVEMAPGNSAGYLAQALLLDKMGDPEKALDLLGKARDLAPDDRVLAAIVNDTQKKVTLLQDQQKRERINKLVKELLEQKKAQPRALPWDSWTSRPLTLWIMDFATQGYSLQEGEERLIAIGITDKVLQHGRVRVVERSLLETMMQELKLGTSELADRNTALALGRILAARLIVFGRINYSGSQTQVSMRLVETETGQITAAMSEGVGSAVPVSALTETLSNELLNKLQTIYPLRGKIVSADLKKVGINIGSRAGVKIGQRFQVVNMDTILEVVDVEPEESTTTFLEGEKTLVEGQRVEAD
jgi:class 3 adenylate cyclase/CHAT domain-containing protein/Flp pilus assembly protein TadD